ncbi:enoyl-CoA hydratase/isomerase family protein [Saccharopolyspora sp. NPDC000995]
MSGQVIQNSTNGVHFVSIVVPQRRNALSRDVLAQLREAFTDAPSGGADAVVLSGGGGVFSAGADFSDLTGTAADLSFDDDLEETVAAIRATSVPVLAAVEGPCIGAGLEIALACDIRVAGADAWLQLPSVRMGILYNPLSIARLHRTLPRDTLTRLLVLGERFTATAAAHAGLINEVVPRGETLTRATEIAGRFDQVPAEALARTKELLSELDDGSVDMQRWRRVRAQLLDSAERRNAVAAARRQHA